MGPRTRLPSFLSQSQSDALVAAAQADIQSAKTPAKRFAARRDLTMIATGSLAGLRIAEMCSLQVPDLDLAGATIGVKEGKGGKDAYLPIGRRLAPFLEGWIGDRKTGYVFPGPNGKRLSSRTFQRRLKSLATRAGIQRRVHPHMLRHTFATSLLRGGSDIVNVSKLMRHSDVRTTLIYLHCDPGRFKSDVDRL